MFITFLLFLSVVQETEFYLQMWKNEAKITSVRAMLNTDLQLPTQGQSADSSAPSKVLKNTYLKA